MENKFRAFDVAGKAWPILIELANSREIITYGVLAEQLKVHHRSCRYFLSLIQNHCKENKLPPLQSLVVNKNSKRPGEGYWATSTTNMSEVHSSVFDFNWKTQENPFL